jgi:alpha-galactosidase
MMYQRTWDLFDDLHKEVPNLFIDCTYETMGGLQLIDLDMCKHAEGNWLSNFLESAPLGALRVRQMSWWRTPAIPATALVIGNQRLDDPQFKLSYMSMAGSLPIVLGDPRKLSMEQRADIRKWALFLSAMEEKHGFMTYRQDLSGFGEPAEGCWDGFQRINTDSGSGGIIGVFKQNSRESQRTVTVSFLDEDSIYTVKRAPDGETVHTATGKELSEKGFEVILTDNFAGAVFEITR